MAKHESRPQRWRRAAAAASEAIQELVDLQEEYQEWRENLPENLEHSPLAEKLDSVVYLDLESALNAVNEAEDTDLPLGFGRD